MRHQVTALVLFAALLSACVKVAPVGTSGNSHTRVAASGSPVVSPLPTPGGVPGRPELLLPPAGESSPLHGQIALDASYALANGGAILSNNAAGVLQVQGGQLVSDAGGNFVGQDPGAIASHLGAGLVSEVRLVSEQGGQLVSKAKLVSDNGGGIISNNSSGVVSNNSGGIIANNGGGLVGKTKYTLAGTGTGTGTGTNTGTGTGTVIGTAAATGTGAGIGHAAVPTAGMIVGVWSLAINGYLPLGVNHAGQPVYAVYSDAKGQFTVHLPHAEQKNVLVVASVPGTQDTRLAVDLVANPGVAGGLNVDERSTAITTYLRRTLLRRLEAIEAPDPCTLPEDSSTKRTDVFAIAMSFFAEQFGAPAYQALDRNARERVLIRFAYDLVSRVPLEKIVILPNLTAESTASGLAFPLLRDDFGQFNDAAARKLATSETFFDHRPYVTMANFARGGQPAYQIRKPSDLVELCVNEFLTTADPVRRHRLDSVLVDLDLPVSLQGDLTAAGGTLFAALIAPLTTDKDAIFAVLKGAIVDEGRAAKSSSSPCVAAPTAGDLLADVTTFAGIGKPGDANRVAAACTFNGPTNLCLDPFNALLVSEDGGNRIRRIDLVDPNHAVTTLAGDGQRAFAEGPARVAQFNAPAGMVVDAHNSAHPVLYVADSGNNRIRMIADYTSTAAATVSTLAGDGTQDYADGSGATARFNNPQGLALGKDGALYVSDTDNNRLRRIDLVDPAHTVTTLAGSGTGKSIVGIGVLAAFHEPRGIAFTPFGDLLVVDTHRHKIRWVNSTGSVGDYAGDGPDGGADNDYYSALFNYPRGIAVDASGNAVLADTDNQAIRWLDKRGFVVTIAGGGTKGKDAGGYLDGHGAVAQFNSPRGVAIAEDGTIYVADTRNHRIRMLKLPAH